MNLLRISDISSKKCLYFHCDFQTVLEDTLAAFGAVCKHEGFAYTPVVLFLNKKDVFKSKLKVSPLCKYMPEYKGNSNLSFF